MKKALALVLTAVMMASSLMAAPAGASGGITTVDPEGTGANWSHATYGHRVVITFDYPAGDPTPQRAMINWRRVANGYFMCNVPMGGVCNTSLIGKYTNAYSADDKPVGGAMGDRWVFGGDGPWGAGRRLLLIYYPDLGNNGWGVHPSHSEDVSLVVDIKDGYGTWTGAVTQVLSVN